MLTKLFNRKAINEVKFRIRWYKMCVEDYSTYLKVYEKSDWYRENAPDTIEYIRKELEKYQFLLAQTEDLLRSIMNLI